LLITGCESQLIGGDEITSNVKAGANISWWYEDNDIIIKINKIENDLQYYAEITLISGRRIAVQLATPDVKEQFRIPDNFGRFIGISIYTNLDLEKEY
jgi:hypothetical protein